MKLDQIVEMKGLKHLRELLKNEVRTTILHLQANKMACRIMPERLKLLVAALQTSVSCILTGSQVIQGDKLYDKISKALKAPLEK